MPVSEHGTGDSYIQCDVCHGKHIVGGDDIGVECYQNLRSNSDKWYASINIGDELIRLLSTINGDDSNLIEFNSMSDTWHLQAINDGCCPLGEVCGDIEISAKTLPELLVKFEIAIKDYNKSK